MARKKRKKNKKKSFFKTFVKWSFVLFLWSIIISGCAILWLARDLPQITSNPKFERKSAMTFVDNEGKTIARYGEIKGISVSVGELPPHLIQAVLAIEDRRFYEHSGIDFIGFARAMTTNIIRMKLVQGGSTITQQLAKNMFLSHERTISRKIKEAILAIWLEKNLTKDEILSAYLNRVYLGAGAYGVDAASHIYFNKPASELNLIESATIAGLLKAPSRYSPLSNPDLAKSRAQIVIKAMKDAGYIKHIETTNIPIPRPKKIFKNANSKKYFTDWTINNIDNLISAEISKKDLTFHTTLDSKIQNTAETTLVNVIKEFGSKKNITQGAVIVMRNDGAILAMVGGYNYNKSQFNRATQAYRPPGSAFKPVLYLTALMNGWTPKSKILDAPIKNGKYKPENFNNKYMGEVTLETALANSLNSASVRLIKDVGVNNTIKTARKLGIKATLNQDQSLALGSSGIPLIEMATAYATISNQGKSVTPYGIYSVIDKENNIIYEHETITPKQKIPATKARTLTKMLEKVINEGTGKNAHINAPAAGKTGTSQDYRDALFIGYSYPYITAIWLGNDDNSPMNSVTGGSYPAKIWKKIMNEALSVKEKHKSSDYTKTNDSFYEMLQNLLSNTKSPPPTYND